MFIFKVEYKNRWSFNTEKKTDETRLKTTRTITMTTTTMAKVMTKTNKTKTQNARERRNKKNITRWSCKKRKLWKAIKSYCIALNLPVFLSLTHYNAHRTHSHIQILIFLLLLLWLFISFFLSFGVYVYASYYDRFALAYALVHIKCRPNCVSITPPISTKLSAVSKKNSSVSSGSSSIYRLNGSRCVCVCVLVCLRKQWILFNQRRNLNGRKVTYKCGVHDIHNCLIDICIHHLMCVRVCVHVCVCSM